MSLLRVHNFVVSLDGYAAGERQSREAGFGHAQPVFEQWFAELRLWRGMGAGLDVGLNEAIASAWETRIGAEIMGRNKYRPTTGPWPTDGWQGWWSEEAPFHTPCFVLTHHEKETIKVGDTTFHFVSGTPADVLELARQAAGGLDIRLGGGPSTVNQFLAAGLVDYLHVIQIPVLLGRGVPLWNGLEGLHTRYAIESVTVPSGATHLFFTRRPDAR
jgi:dihydrofolate reductase